MSRDYASFADYAYYASRPPRAQDGLHDYCAGDYGKRFRGDAARVNA